MRKINPKDFKLATRFTSREINRQIALTLIQTHQPVSRADLARLMNTNRANITFLINELLQENLVREGAQGSEKVRGRKPTFLYLNSQKRIAVAVDVRKSRTHLMVTDALGNQIGEITNFASELDPAKFVRSLGKRIRQAIGGDVDPATCEGIGITVPGMMDLVQGRADRADAWLARRPVRGAARRGVSRRESPA